MVKFKALWKHIIDVTEDKHLKRFTPGNTSPQETARESAKKSQRETKCEINK